ncbi:MAG: hypothetical protein AAB857_02785 [Patescibacteria group bacterium]
MQFKFPKNDEKYFWTNHVGRKMLYYGLSPDRVKRVIRSPYRSEKGIVPDTIGVMQPGSRSRRGFAGQKTSASLPGRPGKADWKEEIWVMYAEKKNRPNEKHNFIGKKKVIITAWRYPGVSPVRDEIPIPVDILEELKREGVLK